MSTIFVESTRQLFNKISRALTGNSDLEVIFSEHAPTSTDFDNIYINTKNINNFELENIEKYLMALFLNYHEIAHNLYTDMGSLDKLKKEYSDSDVELKIAHEILNILEDIRIETALIADYQGLSKIRKFTNGFYYEKYKEQKKQVHPIREFFSTLLNYVFFKELPSEFQHDRIEKIFNKAEVLERIENVPYAETTNSLFPIVSFLMIEIEDLIEQAKEDQQKLQELLDQLKEMEGQDRDQRISDFENNDSSNREVKQNQAKPPEKNQKNKKEKEKNSSSNSSSSNKDQDEKEDNENNESDKNSGISNSDEKDKENEKDKEGSGSGNSDNNEEDNKEDNNNSSNSSNSENNSEKENNKNSNSSDNKTKEDDENNKEGNGDSSEESENSKENNSNSKNSNKSSTEENEEANTEDDTSQKKKHSSNNEERSNKEPGKIVDPEGDGESNNPGLTEEEKEDLLKEKSEELNRLLEKEEERKKKEDEENKKMKENTYDMSDIDLSDINSSTGLIDVSPKRPEEITEKEKQSYKDYLISVKPYVKDFTKSINRIITFRKNNVKKRNKKSGKLDNRNLYKVKTGKDNMFYQKRKNLPDLSFMLLLDASGSMSGERDRMALKAGIMFHEGLQELRIKHALWSFTTNTNRDFHYSNRGAVVNKRHINFENSLNPRFNYGVMDYRGIDFNRDGYSIRVAAKALLEQREKQKIMFVVSDGRPNHNDYNRPYVVNYEDKKALKDTKQAIIEAERKGIKVVGISIGNKHNHIDYLYKNKIKVNNLKHLNKKIETLLKRFILS